jgi:dGTPase
MLWPQLLSYKRIGSKNVSTAGTTRTDFQRDFDRIVFSSAFRRMQDKTQVFPLSKIDYVRTRLTHSLESSSVGRSLGTLVGEQIITRHGLFNFNASDFGDICAAACLAHDIGNPPFSHAGEDAIRHWANFADYGQSRVAGLRGSQREDFLKFEGNAQGFRILTRLQNASSHGGLQLTCATLGAFTKYPRESWLGDNYHQGISTTKHGFFFEDVKLFEEVANTLGLIRRDKKRAMWCRHPLAFLVEAADDICYRVVDIEDGFRLGHLTYKEVLDLFWPILSNTIRRQAKLEQLTNDKERVEFLRAKVINEIIKQSKDSFLDQEEAILSGKFDAPLLEYIPKRVEFQRLLEIAQSRIYCTPEVVDIEIAGFEVLGQLLERLMQAVDDLAENPTNAKAISRMTSLLIPEQFLGSNRNVSPEPYIRLLHLTDFISGMTDSYAVYLFKKLTGISLPV